MNQTLPLSCFIIAKNEADRIAQTITSVTNLASEVLVIEQGSTDDTVRVAEQAGAKVFHNEWSGFGQQKRFAEQQCTHDWVLNLDADEVLSDELITEIRQLFAKGTPPIAGYRFRQVTVYPGRLRPRLWADGHNYIRLYDRTRMRFANSASHDAVEPKDHPIGQLSQIALHYSWRSLSHLAEKYDLYTDLQATTLKPKPVWILGLRLLTEFPLHFIKTYWVHRHFTGGWHGFAASVIIAWSRQQRIVKLLKARFS
ncbi:MAG: glycosyl transferase [Robiginitomaculum sp.]|nr:MAG: glycosyl transferase [Robiginitomaculum sp.]